MKETAGPLDGLRLLVVDDDADNLETVATLLELNGALVQRCRNVARAREQLASFRPHLLVSDLSMPGDNGFDLILGIRRLSPEDGGELPAIAFSASVDPEWRERAYQSGFQAFVPKLDVGLLLSAILAWTGRGLG